MAKRFLSDIHATAGLKDSSGDLGSDGQVLSSTGAGTNWVQAGSGATVIYDDQFTATANQTVFTLSNTVDAENKTQVYIDGAYQAKAGYTVSGTTLTFDTGLDLSSKVEVITFATAIASNATAVIKLDEFVPGDAISGTSGQHFTLSQIVSDEKVTQVYINGVYQHKDTYSISGTTLQFSSAPPSGSDIEVITFDTVVAADGTLSATTFLGDLNGTINTATTATTQSAGNNSTLVATTEFATTALNLKSNIASPTFTGTVGGITKAMVGLSNVDNTTDALKPVSTAGQAALDLKSNIAGPTFTGTPAAPTASAGTNTTQLATTAFVNTGIANIVDSAPGTLNTLNELAAALGDDVNFSTTVTDSIATKLPLAGGTLTGALVGTSAGFTRLDINATSVKLKGDLLGNADAAYDIGASGANRPRNLYLSNSISAADITTTGAGIFGGNVGIGGSPSVSLEIAKSGARIKLIDGTNQLNMGLWDGSNYRIEGDANRKILITSYHSDGIHLGGSGNSHLVVKGGNVGIGTTTLVSTAQLTVVGNYHTDFIRNYYGSARGYLLRFGANTASSGYVIGSQIAGSLANNDADGSLEFFTKSSGTLAERLRISSGGKVGIGTTSIDYGKLEIKTSSAIAYTPNAFNQNPNIRLVTGGTAATNVTTGISMAVGGSAETYIGTVQNSSGHGDIVFQGYDNSTGSGYEEKMRITSGGSVGIGNSNPSAFNTLSGNHLVIGDGSQANNLTLYSSSASSLNGYGHIAFTDTNTSSSTAQYAGLIQYYHGDNAMQFYTNSSIKMRITSGGNIAMGAPTSGAAPLHVKYTSGSYNSEATSGIISHATSGRGTVRIRSDIDDAAELFFDVGGAIRWDISARGSASSYKMMWFPQAPTPALTGVSNYVMSLTQAGDLAIDGALSKGSGSFTIDHPLESKKDTHHLVHSFVESPQANNIYRGKVDLVNGTAQVNLDDVSTMTDGTFILLNTDIHCYTSNETNWDPVKGSVEGNILTIECQNNESNASVNWLVIGERHDPHMLETGWTDENGKVIVEPIKTDNGIN